MYRSEYALGQGENSQAFASKLFPVQSSPPCWAKTAIVLVRNEVPSGSRHVVAEHGDHKDHSLHSQSTGAGGGSGLGGGEGRGVGVGVAIGAGVGSDEGEGGEVVGSGKGEGAGSGVGVTLGEVDDMETSVGVESCARREVTTSTKIAHTQTMCRDLKLTIGFGALIRSTTPASKEGMTATSIPTAIHCRC